MIFSQVARMLLLSRGLLLSQLSSFRPGIVFLLVLHFALVGRVPGSELALCSIGRNIDYGRGPFFLEPNGDFRRFRLSPLCCLSLLRSWLFGLTRTGGIINLGSSSHFLEHLCLFRGCARNVSFGEDLRLLGIFGEYRYGVFRLSYHFPRLSCEGCFQFGALCSLTNQYR